MISNCLRIENLKVHYQIRGSLFSPTRIVHAVDGVSIRLKAGETLGLVGESGCGKSTLGRAIMRLVPINAGKIFLNDLPLSELRGQSLRDTRKFFQMIFQNPYASLNPRMRVGDILKEALKAHASPNFEQLNVEVAALLNMVNLSPSMLQKYPHEFAGGQRQRIAIARALALRPQLIIADEPVSALDVSIQAQIINLLLELKAELGLSMIFISHDLSVVKHVSDRIAVMYLGKIVEIGMASKVLEEPLHPYTRALVSAIPQIDPVANSKQRILLEGDPPSPIHPPNGCSFHERCFMATESCTQIIPSLVQKPSPRLAPGSGKSSEDAHLAACIRL